MDGNEQKVERLSFWQLLEETSVEIPIIQRDYAQGRAKKEKVRNAFLDALYGALKDKNSKPVELDFVYGSEEKNILQPLDGQQRLTTLFLLHWFIANKEGKLDGAKERLVKFTYETRTSSREFCRELAEKSVDYQSLLPDDTDNEGKNKNNSLSKTIKNAAWFVEAWQKDPTISAMLIMIDAIQVKFKDTSDIWEKLTSEQAIAFLYIKLENFGLSDDLYIKMNARGKQLTSFEHFKSQFIRHIETNKWEKKIDPKETFAHKIDTVWTDLFWNYRDKDPVPVIDNKMTKFIAGIAINYFSQKRENSDRIILLAKKDAEEVSPEDFPTKESFDYLVQCLKLYAEKKDDRYSNADIKPEIPLWNHCSENLFKDFIQYDDSKWQERTLFFAQTIYLRKIKNYNEDCFNEDCFNDWMRVVRNIVENSTINKADSFLDAIALVTEMSKGCENVYQYLSAASIESSFAQEQVKEEIEKAKIIIANPAAKKVIHDTEDTEFCKGKIDFALYCTDYDIEHPNPGAFNKDKLKKICKVIKARLSDDDVSNNFRRAFFTIQNNDFYEYWSEKMCGEQFVRYCLLESTDDFKTGFVLRGENNANINNNNWAYSKELLNKLSHSSINNIISNFQKSSGFGKIPAWKQTIINKPELLKKCKRHYICCHKKDDKWYIIKKAAKVRSNNWDGLIEIK